MRTIVWLWLCNLPVVIALANWPTLKTFTGCSWEVLAGTWLICGFNLIAVVVIAVVRENRRRARWRNRSRLDLGHVDG